MGVAEFGAALMGTYLAILARVLLPDTQRAATQVASLYPGAPADVALLAPAFLAGSASAAVILAAARHCPSAGQPILLTALALRGNLGILAVLSLASLQILGAVVGAFLARAILFEELFLRPYPLVSAAPTINIGQAMVFETVGSALLVAVAFSVGRFHPARSRWSAPVSMAAAVGVATLALTLVGRTISGACLNPAVALGAWAATQTSVDSFVFLIAPLSGAAIISILVPIDVNSFRESPKLTGEATER
jgi:glycerol uptake facilitator-like aquaporin